MICLRTLVPWNLLWSHVLRCGDWTKKYILYYMGTSSFTMTETHIGKFLKPESFPPQSESKIWEFRPNNHTSIYAWDEFLVMIFSIQNCQIFLLLGPERALFFRWLHDTINETHRENTWPKFPKKGGEKKKTKKREKPQKKIKYISI